MPATSGTWRVTYPRRSPHPRRAQMRVDPQQMVTAKTDSKTNQKPWFDWNSPLPPTWDNEELSSSMLSRLPGQPEGGGGPTASVELGSSSSSRRATSSQIDGGRAVRFDSVVKMILVPCRLDLSDGLSDELWWNGEDYLQFRLGAIAEGGAGVLLRALRNKRSRRDCSRAANTAKPPGTRALQRVGARSGSNHLHSLSFSSRRTQPVTPPTSPANQQYSSGVSI